MKLYVALAIVSGVAAGLVSSLFTSQLTRRDPEVPAGVRPSSADANRSGDLSAKERALEERLSRMEGLERAARGASPPTANSGGAAPPAPVDPSAAPSREEMEADFAQLVSAHYMEPEERSWAAAAQQSISKDLEELLRGQGDRIRVAKLSCRTTTCAVELEWPTFAIASTAWAPLLNHNYKVGCGRHIVLPEPPAGAAADAPYRSTLLLDCEEARVRDLEGSR